MPLWALFVGTNTGPAKESDCFISPEGLRLLSTDGPCCGEVGACGWSSWPAEKWEGEGRSPFWTGWANWCKLDMNSCTDGGFRSSKSHLAVLLSWEKGTLLRVCNPTGWPACSLRESSCQDGCWWIFSESWCDGPLWLILSWEEMCLTPNGA